jgi:hypothetical protein
MSKNAAEQYCLFSRTSFILHIIRCVCSIVECLCLKPNRRLDINPLLSTIGRSLLKGAVQKL